MKRLWCVLIFLCLTGLFYGCPSKTKTNENNGSSHPQSLACIKGKVFDNDGNALTGAVVSIKPAPAKTSQISGSKGDFELCYLLKVLNKDTRETAKVPIKKGKYTLVVSVQGYKNNSKQVAFQGKTMSVGEITVESTEKEAGEIQISERPTPTNNGGSSNILR